MLASLVLALLVLLPGVAAPAAPAPAPETKASGEAPLTITSITPVVEGEGTATVRGRLTNTGSQVLERTRVTIVAQPPDGDRSEIARWAKGKEPVLGEALDAQNIADVPAGGSVPFVLTVAASELVPGVSAGAARVSIQTGEDAVHTFIGVHRTKEYVPLEIVWGIPLLLPGDRALFGERGASRERAWRETVGPGSRLDQLTASPPAADEAWLLDPSLLRVPADEGEEEGGPAAEERSLRAQWATTLRSRLIGSRTLVLPDADADVAAGATSAEAADLVRPRVERGTEVAHRINARSDVLWPADGLATKDRARDLRRLRPTGKAPTLLVPDSSLTPDAFTPTGSARTTDGTALVVTDDPLSRLVSDLDPTTDATLARQQLVAETAAVLSERPGTARTLVVVPRRDSAPSPRAWKALRGSTDRIPWVAGGSLRSVLDDAAQAAPLQTARTPGQIAEATKGAGTGDLVLTGDRARRILQGQRSMRTFASVRPDGTAWRRRVQPSLNQLTSSRWRWQRYGFLRLYQQLGDEVTLDAQDLEVSSGEVNFFADTGRLQITIYNRTDVELSNLTVRLTPRTPSLRIDGAADPVTIGPGGRQTVTVQASALAAGQVPVEVAVTAPDGQELADPAILRVKVRPTGDSIYWVIGSASVLMLAVGTWRTVRGGRRPAGVADVHTKEDA